MSDSVRPHRRQPTRLCRPWDSPGKNTGVGCHFLLPCMKVKSESEVAQSCPTLSDPLDCSLPGSSIHGIFQARILEWGAIALSERRSPANHFKCLWGCSLRVILNGLRFVLRLQLPECHFTRSLPDASKVLIVCLLFKLPLKGRNTWICVLVLGLLGSESKKQALWELKLALQCFSILATH